MPRRRSGCATGRASAASASSRLPSATVTTGLPRLSPEEARDKGAQALVIGVANSGGFIAASWVPALVEALESGLHIISGMHARLA